MNIDFDTLSEDYDFYKYRVSAKIFSDLIDKKGFKKVEVAEKMGSLLYKRSKQTVGREIFVVKVR